jgi:hypothetical protein
MAAGSRVGVAAGPRGTYHASAAALGVQGAYVRQGFAYRNAFTPAWYARYPGAWLATGLVAGAAWNAASWGSVSSYCDYPAEPVYYDYGSSVVYQGDTVYVNGDPAGTPEQYAQQAVALADSGSVAQPEPADAPAQGESWQPLGVFALVEGEQTTSFNIFQLAINKGGIVRGNYYNALTDSTEPVHGSVDEKTQRVAWAVGDRKTPTYEAGIANLTEDETTAMVHFGGDRSQQFTLVRIEKPETGQSAAGE